ncbi:MAG: GAF domain-containing protein [Bacteroidetes bacterium]|nr:MAG: GAF domain-containing protein [Bacteroidota bacterium]
MKKSNVLIFLFVLIGLATMFITMFHPFEMAMNKIIPTINIAILIAMGYFYFTFSSTTISEKEISNSNFEDRKEKTTDIVTKTSEEIFEELIKKNLNIVDKTKSGAKNAEKVLSFLCSNFNFSQGIVYKTNIDGDKTLKMIATYAFFGDVETIEEIVWGEGITGQAAKNNEFLYVDNVPKGLLRIASGLGESNPDMMIIAPILVNNVNIGMIELAGFGTMQLNEREAIQMIIEYVSKELNF